jgi:hypothetical protein
MVFFVHHHALSFCVLSSRDGIAARRFFVKLSIFGRHKQLEHFTVTLVAVMSVLLVSFVGLTVKMFHDQRVSLSEDVIYTKDVAFSRSGASGRVHGIYTNENHTKAFVMLAMEDTSKISTNADDYSAFVIGMSANRDVEDVRSVMSGAFYSFGSSGYMGIYITCPDGFVSQILYMLLRNNNQVGRTVADGASGDNRGDIASFAESDQLGFYFNPGGANSTKLSCLEGDGMPSSTDVFYETVLQSSESSVRETLDDDLRLMQADLRSIAQFEDRLVTQDKMALPEKPVVITGDAVEVADDGTLTYRPQQVVAGGCDFDWRSDSVATGYFEKLGVLDSLDGYIQKLDKLSSSRDASSEFKLSNARWTFADGRDFVEFGKTDTSESYAIISRDCSALIDAWTAYYEHKSAYERSHLKSLLQLESRRRAISNLTSLNANDDFMSVV